MQNQKGNMNVIVSFIIVVLIVVLVIWSLMRKGDQDDTKININPNEQIPNTSMDTNTNTLQNFTPVSKVSSLEKTDIVVGTGEEVKAGATVSVHYTGAVASTGAIFQSSKDFGTEPVTFPLGGVIKGWTDGIPGMKVGGTRRLLIPSAQAYGANPPAGSGIPANADLVFDVELVSVK